MRVMSDRNTRCYTELLYTAASRLALQLPNSLHSRSSLLALYRYQSPYHHSPLTAFASLVANYPACSGCIARVDPPAATGHASTA